MINVATKSIPELEKLLEGPLAPHDRETIEKELRQRGEKPLRGMLETPTNDVRQLGLFDV